MKKIKQKNNINLFQWMDIWLKNQIPFLKESTYATYFNIIENHIKNSFLANKNIEEITANDLQLFLFEKLKNGKIYGNGGLSNKTTKDILTLIKTTLNFAIKENIITNKNFDYKFPKNNELTKIKVFNNDESKKLFDYIQNILLNSNDYSDTVFLGILISLFYGLRLGEICALKWEDFNLKEEVFTVNKSLQKIYFTSTEKQKSISKIILSTPKTVSSNRTLPLNNYIISILKKFKQNNNYYILSNKEIPIKPHTYRNFYFSILKKLNIKKLPFHSLRHTFATNAIELGIDCKTISEILGHSSINTTLNIYTHPKIEHKRKCINLIYETLNF